MKFNTLAVILILFISSCAQQRDAESEKPVLTVSVLPQKYFVEALLGSEVEVNVMVPQGASPATYEPTVSQLSLLDNSALYMQIGHLGFELGWMEKMRSVNPQMEVIDLSEGIELIYGNEEANNHEHGHGHSHEGADPHIWMSARNAQIMAKHMAEELAGAFPDKEEQITVRLVAFLATLDSLDREIGRLLEGSEGRSFMIYHPALTYFARDYGLVQLSLEIEGKTPSPSHMKELTDLGRKNKVSSILIQEEFDQKNARILASEIGADIISVNPLEEDWKSQILFIAKKLKQQW